MKMRKFHLLKNNKGSILLFNVTLIVVLVIFLFGLIKINNGALKLLDIQNKQDAHALSVISLYAYTLNEITYTNRRLQELGLINSLIKNVPALKALSVSVEAIIFSIKKYQDFLLLKLKIEAKIIDLKLKKTNKLPLTFEYHLINYRRQKSILPLFNPELIEIKEDVFDTACVNSVNVVNRNKTCVYNASYYEKEKSWFAPLRDTWSFKIYAK